MLYQHENYANVREDIKPLIIKHWEEQEQRPEPYTAGSWGPAAATLLLARDGRLWDENS